MDLILYFVFEKEKIACFRASLAFYKASNWFSYSLISPVIQDWINCWIYGKQRNYKGIQKPCIFFLHNNTCCNRTSHAWGWKVIPKGLPRMLLFSLVRVQPQRFDRWQNLLDYFHPPLSELHRCYDDGINKVLWSGKL